MKLETNSKQKINETDKQNSEDVDHINGDRANSEESASVLRQSSRENIVYSVCFLCEKDKLHCSKYGSTKHKNLIRCELSSNEVSLKRMMMDNLKSDDPSLVATAKRLQITSDKDAHSADVLYH